MQLYKLIFILLGSTITLFAQPVEVDSIKYKLQEITVFGQSSKEIFLEVPAAINGINIDKIIMPGINLKDALQMTPGVFIQNRNGGPLSKIMIRGTGAKSNDAQVTGLKILVDGFPETDPDGRTSLDLVDLSSISRIELSRTPASSFYGTNSGGVINFISNTNFKNSFVEPKTVLASYGFYRNQLSAGLMLGNANALFSAANTNFTGWREHSNRYSTYFSLAIDNKLSNVANLFLSLSGISSFYQLSGPLTYTQFIDNPVQANAVFAARDERRHNKFLRLGFKFDNEIADGHSFSIRGFINPKIIMRSQKNSYRDFNRYNLGGGIEYNYSTKLSGNIFNYFTAGIDEQYQNGTILFYNLTPDNQRGTTLKQNKEEGGNNFGFFVRDEIVFEKVSVLIAGRYSISEYLYDDFMNPELNTTKIFRGFTPSIGISYKVSPLSSVYFNYSEGIGTPAFNEIDPPAELENITGLNPLLSPSKFNSIEAGIKGILTFNSFVLTDINYEISPYYIFGKNELIPYESSGVAYYVSAGETQKYGLETAITLNSNFGLSLQGAITFSRNKFIDFKNTNQNFDNKSIPGIPSEIIILQVSYTLPSGFYVQAGLENLGRIQINNDNKISSSPYTIYNLKMNYKLHILNNSADLFMGIENLFNRTYAASVFVNGSNGEYYEPGLPRNFYGGVKLNFNF